MIDLLNKWMLESTNNFNIVVGLTAILFLGSVIALFIISKKFGQPDERTNGIYFKIISCMFTTQILMNCIFISLVGKDIENFRQIFILFEAFVFFVGAIYSFKLYRQEFK
ncbi:6-aminohexanoate hydrolase [Bacillus pseudomycoides]|uniref:6-aminohexanoate hydrolase n=1 Tax=Bacillus TaxID=1386 RepID=UPI000BF12CA8|nr:MULTISPECIES: 6-aminohexanoate hydrolase [Bacillus]MBC6973924.1 6-aminohexanoate hydrolase [Bacillus sp. Xin]NSW39301.1 6-aminohexanoate hydrolase [Bacillus sp. Xin1]PEI94691.1 6-aminohexanoate hydrolase [Bacillus pseudomycoides]PGA88964.1 6-aminohexanoate hydrolase [Bacillus pseudomycoides]PHF36257.1 6-aminohexanoate hydrolase [Bacillus pseudomycoides]